MKKIINFNILLILFILISVIEIFAEFTKDYFLMSIIKPLLMPLIFVMYISKSNRISYLYILALFFNWISNILFLSEKSNFITIASILFIVSRLFILKKIYKEVKLPTLFPLIIGAIPFMVMFIYLNFLIFDEITIQIFSITIIHSVVMSLFGGIALGNYIMHNDKISKLLLVSAIFYAFNILVLGIKFYYLDLDFLKPMAMVFFILGHYSLLQFIILSDKDVNISKIQK